MKDLSAKFQKFVGRNVANPNRMTADMCPVMSALEQEANNMRLAVKFMHAGKPMASQEFLDHIESAGIPMLTVDIVDTGAHGFVIDSVEMD